MPLKPEDNHERGDRIFRGPYALRACAHCGTTIEAGPRQLAKWGWCVLCQSVTCLHWRCIERCPRVPRSRDHKFLQLSYKDWLCELLEMDVDARTELDKEEETAHGLQYR